MTTFLDELLLGARRRVRAAAAVEPLAAVRERALRRACLPSLRSALSGPHVDVIAEVKRASPSKGSLAPDLDAVAQAEAYRDGGAAAISVLTEPDRFAGSLADLDAVVGAGLPALRKDFIVDPYQVWEARAVGAAAVLLIVAALDDSQLQDLANVSREAGLDALVEVHDRGELERALRIEPRIIGVNARDLRTFEVDRDAFQRLRGNLPDGVLAVAESGVRDPDDVARVGALGADAVLVGETLVTASDPRSTVSALVRAGRRASVA